MSFWDILYQLILGPLKLLFDVIYSCAIGIIHSPGASIIFLSIAINLLVLPLYLRADAMQEEERQQTLKMKPGIDHIKKVFKGDERFMILQTYYRQNHYKPYYVLKGSVSLLLQIPFFMAAYSFLSNLETIKGVSFGPIADLGAPDSLLVIGGVPIHLLPILMTLINVVSGMIYTRGMPLRSKIQLYGMAAVFLVLLYSSPSGLVFYWTLNNVFSLVKNIFMKLPARKIVLKLLCSALGVFIAVFFLFVAPVATAREKGIVLLFFVLLQIPALLQFTKLKKLFSGIGKQKAVDGTKTAGTNKWIVYLSAVLMTILTGVLIPTDVIKSSPAEFVDIMNFQDPMRYILSSLLTAAGMFLIWCIVFYKLSSARLQRAFEIGMPVFAVAFAIDYMFFGKNYGTMSSLLVLDTEPNPETGQTLLNLAVVIAIAVVFVILWKRKPAILLVICLAGSLAVAGMSIMNTSSIRTSAGELKEMSLNTEYEKPVIPLDKTGKNVMVIMLDRAISGFVPFIMNEVPGLLEKYDGFTFYPNTLSYGYHTNIAAPSLYGGYEYVPDGMLARSDELLVDKHNESLLVMPVLFQNEDYDVTVCEPPYVNYNWTTNVEIFDKYPEINAYVTEGMFPWESEEVREHEDHVRNRNLFCYSMFRSVPLLFQQDFYDGGIYHETDAEGLGGARQYKAVKSTFLDAYMVLNNLPEISEVRDEGKGTLLMLTNNTTHERTTLQEPAFEPTPYADNTEYEAEHQIRTSLYGDELTLSDKTNFVKEHYQINAAALIQLGNWFDYMREQGVYDNTRIIIVSDHGCYLNLFGQHLKDKYPEVMEMGYSPDEWEDTMCYNALLMVKDFNAEGFTRDDTFMINADTPTLAMEGVIEDPVNPFTGNEITDEGRYWPEQHLIETAYDVNINNGYYFSDPINITFKGNDVNDLDNWFVEVK